MNTPVSTDGYGRLAASLGRPGMRAWRSRRGPAAAGLGVSVGLCLAFVCAAAWARDGQPRPSAPAIDLSLLSYNVHGLPWPAAGGGASRRAAVIGWLASRYDVVLLQEDFEHHGAIRAQLPGRRVLRGNGMRLDPRLLLAKLLLLPAEILLPGFSPPYGSGLTAIVAPWLRVEDAGVLRHAYHRCAGWLGDRGDCWATKGFLRARIAVATGADGAGPAASCAGPAGEIDVYDTHLDSGGSEASREARRSQLEELARAIARDTGPRALVVAGDLNLSYDRPGDRDLLWALRRRLGLRDTGAGPERGFWREYDHILVRDGERLRIEIAAAGEDGLFVAGDRALSDHPAVYARLRLRPADR